MTATLPVYIGKDAVPRLIEYCRAEHMERFMLVADQNTYQVLGERVENALIGHGFDVQTVVLTGKEIIADEHYLMQVLIRADAMDRVYLAVGSGTITDITRFTSHRSRCPFISLPTAPSVDGFASIVAPLVVGGHKIAPVAQPPVALFADIDVLCAAPRPMIAAGFGDMIGKYTSLADWKLGHLLWDEPYVEPIAQRVRRALENCAAYVDEIGHASEEGVRRVLEGLIESGLCMIAFGTSKPASGSEHHLSHYWEIRLLQDHRPAILHGAKVGVGAVLVARYYDALRQMTREQLIEQLRAAVPPDREQEIQRIRAGYDRPVAEQLIAEQEPFLSMSADTFARLKQRINDRWDEIQATAETVPPSQEIADLIRRAGGPAEAAEIGLSDGYVSDALQYAHYYRPAFTVMKLHWLLGLL